MKKLFLILALVFCATYVSAHTLSWDDVMGEDGYIIYYKAYPTGYTFPSNPAPNNLIHDMSGASEVELDADITEWDLPPENFTAGNRYVFVVKATLEGSINGESDFLCWTYPVDGQVLELPIDSGGDIQINRWADGFTYSAKY